MTGKDSDIRGTVVPFAVVAVGGNSLIADRDHQSIPDQYAAAVATSRHVVDLVQAGTNVVLTHGNGPQVGFILRRSELSIHEIPPVPMDYAGADIQGAVGYMFVKALRNELGRRGIRKQVAAIVTQVLVDRADPAFSDPSKPIGSWMDEDSARSLAEAQHWIVREDAGRGWRRVVPSPRPKEILDLDAIRLLVEHDYLVVTCGGGGIPVVREADSMIRGVEAVIDKDLASSLLATALGAPAFIISTGVERVALNYNTPRETQLDRISAADAKRYLSEGHFAKGSMGPKIQAQIEYLERGGSLGIVTDPDHLTAALEGRAGTRIVSG